MPAGRPKIDLESHKEFIVRLHDAKISYNEILRLLATQHGLLISKNVLEKHLRSWGKKRNTTLPDEDEKASYRDTLIACLVLKQNANDEEVLVVLDSEDLAVTSRKLRQLRIQMGLRRRRSQLNACFQDEEIIRIIGQHVKEGVIMDYGLGHCQTYFRRHGHMISRDDIMYALRLVDPTGVQRRYQKKQHRRKRFTTDGPNDVWSVDAHCKLEIVGIQIYAVIDAYSRKILWIYSGVSGRTAVSVAKQCLLYLKDRKVMPKRFRSDRGVETILVADAFHQLCELDEGRSEEDSIVEKCWLFGKSTANQRIEAWWMQLQSSMLHKWVIFFKKLQQENHFVKDRLADRIAAFAVYMLMIREACAEFVETWNKHRIRTQKNRPHAIAGKPWFLYGYPKEPAVDCGSTPNPERVDALLKDVEAYDLDEFLPAATLEWCHESLWSQHGIDLASLTAKDLLEEEGLGRRAHGQTYLYLKQDIEQHLAAGNNNPTLKETPIPEGSWAWKPSDEAVAAFKEARRNEEPEEFTDHMDVVLAAESDDENYVEYPSDGEGEE